MHIIISPAKSLDFETPVPKTHNSNIRFPDQAKELVKELKKYQTDDLIKLMKVSTSLAQLNHHRYQVWEHPFDDNLVRAALFAFKGEVYTGIDAYSLTSKELEVANNKLRMLSGLYGLLRPFDYILPYRLEMGSKLAVGKHKNLYSFWGDELTALLEKDMDEAGSSVLVNLASNEYFKSINKKKFTKRIVTPVFKDWKNGQYKVLSFYAKKARGLMTRFIIKNNIDNPDDLIAFNDEGYYFKADLSSKDEIVFVRDHEG